ncbi:MAG: matrixin family metalloprotease [Cyanobacteria bacterium RUI128]|nr:matrixin family metalloprotease [Cyanobacteria bacterium RUI128]
MEIKSYLNSSVKKGYLLRWIKMPISVFIAPMKFYSKQGEDLAYRKMVVQALQTWEKASEGLVQFHVVDNLLSSQINVDWRRVDRKALGHCQYNYDSWMRLYGAEVSIGLTDGKIHQAYDSEAEVYHTILHEMGHALGLGHSPYESDIMFTPHQYGVVNLSENDIFSIQCLYTFPAGKSVQEIGMQYSIPTNNDIDLVIRKLDEKYAQELAQEQGGVKSDTDIVPAEQQNIIKTGRDLLDETSGIGDIKRYNMMMQNIGLSKKMQDFFNSQHRDSGK